MRQDNEAKLKATSYLPSTLSGMSIKTKENSGADCYIGNGGSQ